MFEAVGFKLFNMAGVPAPKTNYVQFRIIDEQHEEGTLNAAHPLLNRSGTQYDGDFWGLYLAIEQMDGHFLASWPEDKIHVDFILARVPHSFRIKHAVFQKCFI